MSGKPMSDADIYAFNPPPQPPRPAARRLWPWVLGGLLVLVVAVMAACGLAAWALVDAAREGWHVVIGGEPWDPSASGTLPVAAAALGMGGALGLVLVVTVVVPLALLVAVLCALLGGLLGVGAALLAAAAIVFLVASPLWLPLLLLWLLLRRRPRQPPPAATMGG